MKLYGQSNISKEKELHVQPHKQEGTKGRAKKRVEYIKLLKKHFPKAKKLLCIGARNDHEVKSFINAGYDAIGIDVCQATKHVRQIDAHEIENVFKKNQFDIAFGCHSFEHFHDPHKVFRGINKCVSQGLFFIVPLGDAAHVSEDHACIYDLMQVPDRSLEILHKQPELLTDFAPLGQFDVLHCRDNWKYGNRNDGEVEMILKFLKSNPTMLA